MAGAPAARLAQADAPEECLWEWWSFRSEPRCGEGILVEEPQEIRARDDADHVLCWGMPVRIGT